MNTTQSKTKAEELISKSGDSPKDSTNDLNVNDSQKKLPPIVSDYIDYWNSFVN